MRFLDKFSGRPMVVALLVAMALFDRSGIVAATLLAAALHECGHLLAARLLHVMVAGLHLGLIGAQIEIRGRMLTYGEEWLICASGPLASLLFAALGAVFWNMGAWARYFSCASLVLGILNLLPIQTFDGGRMLRATLSRFGGERVARTVCACFSLFFLFLLLAC